tara:strand:+ start:924 stop:1466 length:543 start_codon:yes stop_codon:yes gene_type:complete
MMDFDPKAKNNNGAKNKNQSSLPRDSVKRSLVKAITWRVIGTLDTFILSFLLITYLGPLLGLDLISEDTNIVQTAGYIALAEVFTKLIIYASHEQIWTRVKWGMSVAAGSKPESYARSAVKTATWRVLASLDTMLLAWLFTGSLITAFSIGSFEVITKLILYFFHERIWQKIGYGQNKFK